MKPIPESELFVVNGKVYALAIDETHLADNVILVGDPARVAKVTKHFDEIVCQAAHREFVTKKGVYKDLEVTVICPGVGTDNNEIALVECFAVRNFDLQTRLPREPQKPLTIIRVGSSGGLQRENPPGTLGIGEYALGLDNTGLFYEHPAEDETVLSIEQQAYELLTEATPPTRRFRGRIHPYASKATPEVAQALRACAKGPCASGITVAASGLFAPQGRRLPGLEITVPDLALVLSRLEANGQKPINFEMESSALFHLARQMGYQVGAICPIINNRHTGEFLGDYGQSEEAAIQTALDALVHLESST